MLNFSASGCVHPRIMTITKIGVGRPHLLLSGIMLSLQINFK